MVIPDADSWIDFLNGHQRGDVLKALVDEAEVVVVGSVLSEIMRGIAEEKERERVVSFLSRLDYAEMSRRSWIRAGNIAADLEAKGLRIPMTDIYVAAVALQAGHEVLTRDKHFNRIPGLQLYDWKDPANA